MIRRNLKRVPFVRCRCGAQSGFVTEDGDSYFMVAFYETGKPRATARPILARLAAAGVRAHVAQAARPVLVIMARHGGDVAEAGKILEAVCARARRNYSAEFRAEKAAWIKKASAEWRAAK